MSNKGKEGNERRDGHMSLCRSYLFVCSVLFFLNRLRAALTIRSLVTSDGGNKVYVLVVEHDLAVLDYLSDFICCLYGTPSAYGVVTMPFSVREGINIFLAGFVPTENLRFRDEALVFKVSEDRGPKSICWGGTGSACSPPSIHPS